MKLLEEIPTFPDRDRRVLLSEYRIDTAEAFFANALHDPGALATALRGADSCPSAAPGGRVMNSPGKCGRGGFEGPPGNGDGP